MAKDELTLNQIAKKIYAGAGGMENVQSVVHCMTRVRMSVRDDSKVDQAKLKNIPGVLGVVDDEQLQVIIGPGKVNKVAKKWSIWPVSDLVRKSLKALVKIKSMQRQQK